MFLKFICKAFFAKNIVKSVGNGGINGRSSLPVLFPGQSTTFRQNRQPFSGKPGDPAGTNTAGKNDLLRGKNKVEWNCRQRRGTANKKQKLPHKKRTAPFPERYTIRSGKWGRFTFPEHSLAGPCCSTRSHAADKKENSPRQAGEVLFFMPVVGVEPTRVISTRDFEFLSSSSIWCHPVISSDIWFPLCKGKIHASTNNNLEYPRFFDAFSPYSVFSVWTAQMEIGGMFRRDAGQNAPLLRHKTKGKSRIMNQIQAKEYYKKLFVNYPDVLSVEEATTLLGFKSQTAIIRRIHQHRIRCLKVGRSFMIPKEYLIDYLLDS